MPEASDKLRHRCRVRGTSESMPAKKKTSKAKKTATAAPKAKKAAKATAKKAPAAAKKTAAKQAPAAAKKTAAKKAPAAAKKTAAKKAPAAAKKTAAKKAPAAAKKTAAKQAPAAAKKTAAKQAPAPAEKTAAQNRTTGLEAKPQGGQGPAGDHDAAIARIEAKAAAAGVTLAKGASAKEIKAAEKALGLTLPEEVVAFYRRHDGSEDEPAVEGRELLSLSRIVDEWKIWKDLLDQGTFEANDHGRPDPGVQKRWWIPEWVPVTYDGAGNHHVLDLAPAAGGTHGQILSFWHDDDERTVVAKSFLSWLEGAAWADDQTGGRVDANEAAANDAGEDDDDDEDDDDEAAGDFRRFEMEQKFWSIRLDGDSYTVRFGKLGTDGTEQTKSFDDEATAKTEHDKLVAAKVKKGYREI
jgi:cell wall assembly regulator SMI1/predicted DNA-binding WGR domain protein